MDGGYRRSSSYYRPCSGFLLRLGYIRYRPDYRGTRAHLDRNVAGIRLVGKDLSGTKRRQNTALQWTAGKYRAECRAYCGNRKLWAGCGSHWRSGQSIRVQTFNLCRRAGIFSEVCRKIWIRTGKIARCHYNDIHGRSLCSDSQRPDADPRRQRTVSCRMYARKERRKNVAAFRYFCRSQRQLPVKSQSDKPDQRTFRIAWQRLAGNLLAGLQQDCAGSTLLLHSVQSDSGKTFHIQYRIFPQHELLRTDCFRSDYSCRPDCKNGCRGQVWKNDSAQYRWVPVYLLCQYSGLARWRRIKRAGTLYSCAGQLSPAQCRQSWFDWRLFLLRSHGRIYRWYKYCSGWGGLCRSGLVWYEWRRPEGSSYRRKV